MKKVQRRTTNDYLDMLILAESEHDSGNIKTLLFNLIVSYLTGLLRRLLKIDEDELEVLKRQRREELKSMFSN